MRKINLGFITFLIWICSSIIVEAQDGAGAARYRLSYRDDPSTTVVIGWDQVAGADATVYYGTTDEGTTSGNYTNSHAVDRVEDSHGMKSRFARLTGLTPNTVYYFVLDNGMFLTCDFEENVRGQWERLQEALRPGGLKPIFGRERARNG